MTKEVVYVQLSDDEKDFLSDWLTTLGNELEMSLSGDCEPWPGGIKERDWTYRWANSVHDGDPLTCNEVRKIVRRLRRFPVCVVCRDFRAPQEGQVEEFLSKCDGVMHTATMAERRRALAPQEPNEAQEA